MRKQKGPGRTNFDPSDQKPPKNGLPGKVEKSKTDPGIPLASPVGPPGCTVSPELAWTLSKMCFLTQRKELQAGHAPLLTPQQPTLSHVGSEILCATARSRASPQMVRVAYMRTGRVVTGVGG